MGALLTIPLPETKDLPLCDTIEDVEKRDKKF